MIFWQYRLTTRAVLLPSFNLELEPLSFVGYGLMFCFGVPFSNLSQMVPFIILGVGVRIRLCFMYFTLPDTETKPSPSNHHSLTIRLSLLGHISDGLPKKIEWILS